MKDFIELIDFSSYMPGQNIYDIDIVSEGLIKTYPIDFLTKYLSKFLSAGNCINDINAEKLNNTATVAIYSGFDENLFTAIKGILNVNGYFASLTTLYRTDKSPILIKSFDPKTIIKEIDSFSPKTVFISIESKFDVVLSKTETPRFLIHVTENKNVANILKNGLIPKAKNKKAEHPERIYFTFDYETAKLFIDNFAFLTHKNTEDFVMLVVDLLTINIKLMKDPNALFPNGKPYGVYTYDNITPNNISLHKELEI